MSRVLLMLLLLSLFELSCTNAKSVKHDITEIGQLKTENDSLKNKLIKNKEKLRLEVNMIVSDAKAAADYYKKVLNAKIISQTNNEIGMNETMMELGGVEIRVLDENKDFGMIAPVIVGGSAVGINLFVNDINTFFNNAIKEGCIAISPIPFGKL